MNVSGVAPQFAGSSSSDQVPSTAKTSVEDTKNQFLQMLITQLKYQDPMSPMDTNQFMQQTMSMNQLEQMVNMNDNLSKFTEAQKGSLISQYSSIVGKNVLAAGEQFQIAGDNNGQITFNVTDTPKSVEVNVFDANGNFIRAFNPIVGTPGTHTVPFDGKNTQGQDLPDGYYSYRVSAVDSDGKAIPTETYSTGTISSIRLQSGTPIFQMGNKDVAMGDIQKIY